jgi:hypothetical protein
MSGGDAAADALKQVRQGKHTILLLQNGKSPNSRTYLDFETVPLALDGVCKLFEERLKQQFAGQRNITYDVSDLFAFIDGLPDLGALVFDHSTLQYQARNKDWIKEKVLRHLQNVAS